MITLLSLRVAARFQQVADQAPGARGEARRLVTPINRPRGVTREVVRDQGRTEERSEGVKPTRHDLRPKDLFQPTPNNVNMLNYTLKGWPGDSGDYTDMDRALNKQVPKDKGYETVSNLSQYLLETQGGGGTPPAGVNR